jgi:glycosyltransferase involved in cell wall biosynthesis
VAQADVCLSPLYPTPILNAGSPTKLIEYMGMGKAVVANDHPEQKLVLAQSGGGLCVPYDEDAFAEAVLYLLDRPQVAADMGRRGRAYVELHRDYEVIATQVEAQIVKVLKD